MGNVLSNVDSLLKVLNSFAEFEVLREIICEKIMSPIEIVQPNSHVPGASTEVTSLVSCEASNGRKIVRSMSTENTTSVEMTVTNAGSYMEVPQKPVFDDTELAQSSVMKEGRKQTYLQFFMILLVKTEFPSKLATFLLQLLPNQNYKVNFVFVILFQFYCIIREECRILLFIYLFIYLFMQKRNFQLIL